MGMAAGVSGFFDRAHKIVVIVLSVEVIAALPIAAEEFPAHTAAHKTTTKDSVRDSSKPKLVVILVVDQMRGDYIDKFQQQWTGGLKRLVNEGAWFREAAYPYGATETCVGHSTISTGAFPATHGMIANEWWDREQQKNLPCTSDASVKNIGYAGLTVSGGDSAAKMLVPSFADELKIQSSAKSHVVTMSLKARAAITMAGRQGDSVTWFDGATGAWLTSTAYPQAAFVDEFAKSHPVAADYGK